MFLILFALSSAPSALSQIPQGFNYQAIARDEVSGNPVTDPIDVRIAILADDSPDDVIWEEEHAGVEPDDNGLFSIVVGGGVYESGPVLTFSAIDWTVTPKYIRTKIKYGGSWKEMGSAQIWSVPYAMVADSLGGPLKKLSVQGETDDMEEALFEVRNTAGHTVFAVYNEGVRVYVSDGDIKGPKGGFAIGSLGYNKLGDQDYFFVSGDSIRAYIDSTSVKGVKGGFAIGGFEKTKSPGQEYLRVTRDSVRIYLDANPATKGPKGGFAIGSFEKNKGGESFFNVAIDTSGVIDPAENRILWYPLKNAFRTGKVLIEKKDSVGENSFASGFESKAIGKYSQALGYQAIARKDYSTAIGYQAVANKINSFAFGQWATAKNEESYAFGRGAIAEGFRSFAFGSAGIDSLGQTTGNTYSKGNYSFAIGQGSIAEGFGSIALGLADTSRGEYSMALGYKTTGLGYGSIAMGRETKAWGDYSTSIGYKTNASGFASVAIGYLTTASGISVAMGYNTNASGNYSSAMGGHTTASGFASFANGYNAKATDQYCFAMGVNTTASKNASVAFGSGTTASGQWSFAMGYGTAASGNSSTALGSGTIASGFYSTASGYSTTASGHNSVAFGEGTTAPSYCETAVGRFNTTYTPSGTNVWEGVDRLFVIGNGYLSGYTPVRQNAMTVMKSGRIGLQTVTDPTYALELPNSATIGIGRGRANLWATYSDGRVKSERSELKYGLTELMKLKPQSYFQHNSVINNMTIEISDEGSYDIGLIAQEVYEIIPEVVFRPDNEASDLWSMSYEKLVPVLIKAMQEQQTQIESQSGRIEQLEKVISELEEKIASSLP